MNVTLSEFIEIGLAQGRFNLHVKEPEFDLLYVRFGVRILNDGIYKHVLDLANIQVKARLRGTGVFSRLVRKLHADYPWLTLYVENASPLFQNLLLKLEFVRHSFNPDCFYLVAKEPQKKERDETNTELPESRR